MMKVDGARILMLGTPNDGSWAPMQVLSGDDTFGNMLTVVGAPFRGNKTRDLIAHFPGLLQLQAGLLDGLDKRATWEQLAAADLAAVRAHSVWHRLELQLDEFEWGIPSDDVLKRAVSLRKQLDAQRDNDLGGFADKLLLVAGKAAFTPAGYQLGDDGLVYLDAPEEGDGRVTLQSALLPGVATWTLDCEHGALPRRKDAFDAYRELLNTGETKRLARVSAPRAARGAVPSGPALVRSRPARALFAGAPPQRETDVLAPAPRIPPAASSGVAGSALSITVVNGDLTYIAEPLLIGHYRSSRLTGAEAAMDRAIGFTMSASLQRGLYPVEAGTHQLFVNTKPRTDNPWQLPRPEAVIVAGLGGEGELRGADLVKTVRQAVIAWGQRLAERPSTPALFSLATTLLGSGGTGVSAGQAAQLIAQGVREANDQLSGERSERHRWPRVGQLRIIELYLDRAGDAWRSLQALATASPALFTVHPVIEEGIGALRRPSDAGYRGADYDFISALAQTSEDRGEQIVYTIDTRRARSEVRAQATQLPLIRNLVTTASNNPHADPQVGRTLFRLLVPVDLEPFMGSSGATVLEVDRGTAGIPWEILDSHTPGSGDDRPWAIRTKLLRKLRTGAGSIVVNDASADDSVLVIGDPACDRTKYPRLFGARQEAAAVATCLRTSRSATGEGRPGIIPSVTPLISPQDRSDTEPDAIAVINAVMDRGWRIIHIAGHGEPPLATGARTDPRGVVLSNDSFLGPREIGALRIIPELVFVNCCYLAQGDMTQLLTETRNDRAQFASGVAEALIKAGVRCVVAAGWAVDDEAARVFAKVFYERLLDAWSFIDAVAAARVEARACGGNTWAAYQCYGDPDWKYRRATGDAQRPTPLLPSQEFAGIASTIALVLALDTMAVKRELQDGSISEADDLAYVDRLRYLEKAFDPLWRNRGQAAEAFGNAWAKAGRLDEAIGWYEYARTAPDGTASLAAIEQMANLKVRRAWRNVSRTGEEAARKEIADAMALFDTLCAVGQTLERESLYGSAYKRLALIEAAAGHGDQELEAIAKMRAHYAAAEQIARARQGNDATATANVFYPAMNRIAAHLALEGGTPGVGALDPETIATVRRSMSAAPADFWSVVGQAELSMYASMFAGTLEQDLAKLTKEFQDHHARVNAPNKWASVHDNATFVLSKYTGRATPGEAAAAGRLLDALADLAGGSLPPAPKKAASLRRVAKTPRTRRSPRSTRARPSTRRPRR
jgi:tetratricopeptide (TPR) repeat protein